jgi:hypothetical protein
MRDNCTRKFGGGKHTTFDVHMRVTQARDHKGTIGLNHLCIGANAMARIRTTVGKPTIRDGKIMLMQDFARMHVHPCTVSNDNICGFAPSGNGNKTRGTFWPRF